MSVDFEGIRALAVRVARAVRLNRNAPGLLIPRKPWGTTTAFSFGG
jgi:hypothetical protein